VRLFVALELDDQARALLAADQRLLDGLGRAVRWVDPAQIHLTLQFLGEVADPQVPPLTAVLDTLAAQPAFDFQIEGLGTFGSPRSPRIIWVGVRLPNPPLMSLQKACQDRLADLGFRPEERAFKPHLTLGRVKDFGAGRLIHETIEGVRPQLGKVLVQRATEVVLFESALRPQGAQYIAAYKVPLARE
jgi:RNA 2',3'-cyclic 3'-phosphodiesterase